MHGLKEAKLFRPMENCSDEVKTMRRIHFPLKNAVSISPSTELGKKWELQAQTLAWDLSK